MTVSAWMRCLSGHVNHFVCQIIVYMYAMCHTIFTENECGSDAHFLKGRENVSNAVKFTKVGVICYLFDIYDIIAIRNTCK